MKLTRILLLAGLIATGLTSAPALADRPRDHDRRENGAPPREQEQVFEGTRDGRLMPLPQLERRVLPFSGGGDYLGPELNGGVYRFKFIQNGHVVWVDVDGQTGRIIRRSHQ